MFVRNLCIGVVAILAYPASAMAAGFNCLRATTEVEKSICSDEVLSRLDDELNALYYIASHAPRISVPSKRLQTQWLRQRDQCHEKSCLAGIYELRIAGLRKEIGQVADPFPIQGNWLRDYGGGESGYCKLSGNPSSFGVYITKSDADVHGNFQCVYNCGQKIEDGKILSGVIVNNIGDLEYEAGFNQTTRNSAVAVVIDRKLYWAALRDISGSYCITREILPVENSQ